MTGAAQDLAMPATCTIGLTTAGGVEAIPAVGADVVVDTTGALTHVFVPLVTIGGTVRLTFTRPELAALLAELAEAAELSLGDDDAAAPHQSDLWGPR